jgi:hypothetical protein
VPVVDLKTRGLLGGVQNGRWLAPSRISPLMKIETEFLLVGWNGVEEGGVALGKKGETEDVCSDFVRMELDLTADLGVAIGSNARWKPAPRIAAKLSPTSAAYTAVVRNYLAKKGIVKPVIRITQAYRIDLDADGMDEVVITATSYKNGLASNAARGDYSFVLVRKTAGKTVSEYLLAGDFITKKVDFGAPSQYLVSAIADLNGDGKMEIVVAGQYYEGESASAFEIKGGRPVEIKEFQIACGV